MKILMCHNYYQQPGGEDQVFVDEARLLESRGHEVLRFTRHNDAIDRMGAFEVAGRTLWNRETYTELRVLMRRERPEVMHCANTFPLISPSAYHAARSEGVAVVQALHNYRLLCPGALLLRDGRRCEECVGRWSSWPGVVHRCYRRHRAASAVVATMLGVHRLLGTWRRVVDRYYALTPLAREKFIKGGLPAERITVKPNFVDPDPGAGAGQGGYAVFAGRLSPEKGIDTLLDAWRRPETSLPLWVFGDGPLADRVRGAAEQNPRIRWKGRRPGSEILRALGDASCLVMPSICLEGFPKTIVEAFAKGTPVVASRLGAMAELVDDGRTGLLFEAGNAADLAAKVERLARHAPCRRAMREAARAEYLGKYTAEANGAVLMQIYRDALDRKRRKGEKER